MHLDELFNELEDYHQKIDPSGPANPANINDTMLALFMEVAEVVDCVQWKPWKEGQGVVKDMRHLAEELADILFFMGSIMKKSGVTPFQLERAFKNKLEKNYQRLEAGGDHIKRLNR